jgi:hypothetical protein
MRTCIFHDGTKGILNDVVRQLATNRMKFLKDGILGNRMKFLKDGILGDGIEGICNVQF